MYILNNIILKQNLKLSYNRMAFLVYAKVTKKAIFFTKEA